MLKKGLTSNSKFQQIPEDDPRVHSSRCMEFTRSSAACGSGATSVFFDRVQTREQGRDSIRYFRPPIKFEFLKSWTELFHKPMPESVLPES